MGTRIDYAMSIGPRCAAAANLRDAFRHHAARSIFDWQVTPVDSFIRYLEADFRGAFERDDLRQDGGEVSNVRFGTRHPHEFKDSLLPDAAYANARSRHDYLCRRTRGLLLSPYRLLLQLSERIEDHDMNRIEAAIRAYNPALQFILSNGPAIDYEANWKGEASDWGAILSGYSISAMSRIGALASMAAGVKPPYLRPIAPSGINPSERV